MPRPVSEKQDASPRVVGAVAGSLLILVGLGFLGAKLELEHRHPETAPSVSGTDELFQHGVESKTDTNRSWENIDRAATSVDTYGWVDRGVGRVRVPISCAIDLVVADQKSLSAEQTSPHIAP